jgi:hypothetical protein
VEELAFLWIKDTEAHVQLLCGCTVDGQVPDLARLSWLVQLKPLSNSYADFNWPRTSKLPSTVSVQHAPPQNATYRPGSVSSFPKPHHNHNATWFNLKPPQLFRLSLSLALYLLRLCLSCSLCRMKSFHTLLNREQRSHCYNKHNDSNFLTRNHARVHCRLCKIC